MCAVVHRDKDAIRQQIGFLEFVVSELKKKQSLFGKVAILKILPAVHAFLGTYPFLAALMQRISLEEQLVVLSVIVLDQGDLLLTREEALDELIAELVPVEQFYTMMGGIVGYHLTMLQLLHAKEISYEDRWLHQPPHWDIATHNEKTEHYILEGIKSLPMMGHIYPVGGAGDRLNLHDPKTGEPLPAAMLIFCGKTLLEGLIRDVQAEEYLYYQLFGNSVTIPIAMMTSREKDNHEHILSICEDNRWFYRPKSSFRFFCQPLVPTMDEEGNWCLQGPSMPLLKPGGHGVIWRLAEEKGVFDWFEAEGKQKLLIRQINNPVAGVDYGLLAFLGIGCAENKTFGFASCPRKVESNEGMNVLIEKISREGREYCLTNIEYCDFKKYHIHDEPEVAGGEFSKFSSNTNILFADLQKVRQVAQQHPIPGMLLNFKTISCLGDKGQFEEKKVARLESTMQNIADYFSEKEINQLKTYLTYNQRIKTISTTKREWTEGVPLLETPKGCFLDMMHNSADLLTQCGFAVPETFVFLYHPALGPLYSVIAQKIQKGSLALHSELVLEIAQVEIKGLTLDGSLQIKATQVMGHIDQENHLVYSHMNGKCRLRDVVIQNEMRRNEVCEIIIHGNGEFEAFNVRLQGAKRFEVPDGVRMKVLQDTVITEPIRSPTWYWKYEIGSRPPIHLMMEGNG